MGLTLSLLVLTAVALVLGGITLWRRTGYRRQAGLMFVLAAVIAGNVAVWVMPTRGGTTLSDAALK